MMVGRQNGQVSQPAGERCLGLAQEEEEKCVLIAPTGLSLTWGQEWGGQLCLPCSVLEH